MVRIFRIWTGVPDVVCLAGNFALQTENIFAFQFFNLKVIFALCGRANVLNNLCEVVVIYALVFFKITFAHCVNVLLYIGVCFLNYRSSFLCTKIEISKLKEY